MINQKRILKNRTAVLLLCIFFLFSCKEEELKLPFFQSEDFTPEWISPSESDYDHIHQIAPFEFTDQEGQIVTNQTLEGFIYVANFFFTSCPGICPSMMNNMKTLSEDYENDSEVKFISHTVTPWIDSVKVLKNYGIQMEINPQQWHLLTGVEEEIYTLGRKSYFADKEMGKKVGADEFLHTENFLLIDKKGRIRGIYNGTTALEMNRIKEDISILKKEKE